jgi:hypothetical protein
MATTYSSNLAIALQGTGDNPGTWGSITNGNLGTVLEESIVGKAAITFPSDSNYSISMVNGPATSPARCLYLNVTSTGNLSAIRTLTVPNIQKTYIIKNATSGSPSGYSITVTSGAGTTVTVPNGSTMLLYVDGSTGVSQQFSDVASGTTIGGSTIADLTSTQTLTNKTLTAPTVTSGTFTTPSIPVVLSSAYRTSTATSIATSYPTNTTTVTIVDSGVNGAAVGDYVTISGLSTAIGGIPAADLNKTFAIASIVSTSSFTITSGTAATSAASSGSGSGLKYYYGSTIPSANTTLVGTGTTDTLTNKRVTPRVNTVTSSATITPTGDVSDVYTVTALAVNATIAAPTGTPTDGQKLIIRIKDAGVRKSSTLGINAIATTNTSASIVITDSANGAAVGNYVTIAGVSAAIGGIPAASMNTRFAITAVATNTITVLTGSTATSTATGTATASGTLSYDGYGLTWNAIYRAVGTTLPVATTATKTIYVGCIYNAADTKWDVVAVSTQA